MHLKQHSCAAGQVCDCSVTARWPEYSQARVSLQTRLSVVGCMTTGVWSITHRFQRDDLDQTGHFDHATSTLSAVSDNQ